VAPHTLQMAEPYDYEAPGRLSEHYETSRVLAPSVLALGHTITGRPSSLAQGRAAREALGPWRRSKTPSRARFIR
jgi:hypothetical protein